MARMKRPKEVRKSYAIVGEGITEFFYFDGFRNREKDLCIKLHTNAIYFVESNPAFEFWLLLHFIYTDRQFRNCDEVIDELKKKRTYRKLREDDWVFLEKQFIRST